MCSGSERGQSAKKLGEREKEKSGTERERGVKPRHPHPMGHPPLKKELILIRFFI